MPVPYTSFGTATSAIPLSELDANFAAPITLGNTAIQLGNTVTTLNNMTLANVTISSGNVTITNVAITTANVSGTANISTLVVVGNATVGGNTTITGNITAANANVTTNLVLSGGTANGVAYLNTSKVLTTGSALVFDGTNLGVGTNSPGLKLTVSDGTVTAGLNPYATDSVCYFGTTSNHGLAFLTNGSERMRLTSTSLYTASTINVGIGTTNPQYDFVVSNAGAAGVEIGASTFGVIQSYNRSTSAFVDLKQYALNFVFNAGASVDKTMTLDSSGNLGLGVTPGAWVTDYSRKVIQFGPVGSINSLSASTTNNQTYIGSNIINDSGGASRIYADWCSLYLQYLGKHIWQSSSTQTGVVSMVDLMTLDNSGNLLVGDTTSAGAYRLQATASTATAAYAAFFNGGSSAGQGPYVYLPGNRSSDTTYTGLAVGDDSGARFKVLGNGNVQNTNNSYGGISDAKLKENIVDASPKLADLMQVQVRNYNLIGDTTKQLGVVAQELETVFPAMVEEALDIDTEGNDLGTTTKSVKYSVFVPMLIKAIQEQQALITQLTARITALEGA